MNAPISYLYKRRWLDLGGRRIAADLVSQADGLRHLAQRCVISIT